jgi:hypothetical protein
MTPDAIRNLQASLGLPASGVLDASTISAMNRAVAASISANPDIANYVTGSDPTAIADAYMTGDWSKVTDLTGKPFTPEQQQAAVSEAERVLGPAYREAETMDRVDTEDALREGQQGFQDFQSGERKAFITDKDALDRDAAERGILFSGARTQKLNDLRTSYAEREAITRRGVANAANTNARNYQYQYGDEAAKKLSGLYSLPGSSTFNPSKPGGGVTQGGVASVYQPTKYNFQGRKPIAQKVQVQTRAAGQLANTANKLTTSGYGNKF